MDTAAEKRKRTLEDSISRVFDVVESSVTESSRKPSVDETVVIIKSDIAELEVIKTAMYTLDVVIPGWALNTEVDNNSLRLLNVIKDTISDSMARSYSLKSLQEADSQHVYLKMRKLSLQHTQHCVEILQTLDPQWRTSNPSLFEAIKFGLEFDLADKVSKQSEAISITWTIAMIESDTQELLLIKKAMKILDIVVSHWRSVSPQDSSCEGLVDAIKNAVRGSAARPWTAKTLQHAPTHNDNISTRSLSLDKIQSTVDILQNLDPDWRKSMPALPCKKKSCLI